MNVVKTESSYAIALGTPVRVNDDFEVYVVCREPMGSGVNPKLVSLHTGLILPWPENGEPRVRIVRGSFLEAE